MAGGAGPIHAAAIARELEIPHILVPRESSVFCAAGMLISDLKHDYVRTYARAPDEAEMEAIYAELESEALATLAAEGVPRERVELIRSVDLRYAGQFNEVEVPRPEDFHERHEALYGYSMPGAPTELINLRLSARGITDKPALQGSRARWGGPVGGAQGPPRRVLRRRLRRRAGLRRAEARQRQRRARPGDHRAADHDDRPAAGLHRALRRARQLPSGALKPWRSEPRPTRS